jgi:hypothetical protein
MVTVVQLLMIAKKDESSASPQIRNNGFGSDSFLTTFDQSRPKKQHTAEY